MSLLTTTTTTDSDTTRTTTTATTPSSLSSLSLSSLQLHPARRRPRQEEEEEEESGGGRPQPQPQPQQQPQEQQQPQQQQQKQPKRQPQQQPPPKFQVLGRDKEYSNRGTLYQPYVVERYKLVFFHIPKNSNTAWKFVLRRLTGLDDDDHVVANTTTIDATTFINTTTTNNTARNSNRLGIHCIHNPKMNGLKRLGDFTIQEATHMMSSPDWTRAVFLRDPMERFISAYLDRVMKGKDSLAECCRRGGIVYSPSSLSNSSSLSSNLSPLLWKDKMKTMKKKDKMMMKKKEEDACRTYLQTSSLEIAFPLLRTCRNRHWIPQSQRMSNKFWRHINFWGRIETVQEDAERLLRRIGAWEQYGQTGWGINGTEPVFTTRSSSSSNNNNNQNHNNQSHSRNNNRRPRQASRQQRQRQQGQLQQQQQQRRRETLDGRPEDGQAHATHAHDKLFQYLTPKLYQQLSEYYRRDYQHPYLCLTQPQAPPPTITATTTTTATTTLEESQLLLLPPPPPPPICRRRRS